MADNYVVGASGLPFRTTGDEQLQAALKLGSGSTPISHGEAQQLSEAQQRLQQVDQSYGTMGQAAMGGLSGLTLGMGPAALAAIGLVDPEDVMAMQESNAYTAGDIAGTVLPAFFTGGEALGARGLLGTAMRATPAGIMGRLGGASERLAARFLPQSGSIGAKALGMAARGATEGALINVGHTIGDGYIQNKPLSAEAILASGADGALFGGLAGGAMGLVGGIGSKLYEKVPAAVAGGLGDKSMAAVSRRLGMTAEQVGELQSSGSLKETLQSSRKLLDKYDTGHTYSSGTQPLREAYGRVGGVASGAREGVVEQLDKLAPTAVPSLERVGGRLEQEIVVPRMGTMAQREAESFTNGLMGRLQDVEPVKPGTDRRLPGSWKGWVDSRDYLEKAIASGKYGTDAHYAKQALRILDTEIEAAAHGAEALTEQKGLLAKYQSASADMKLAREMEATLGKKQAAELLKHETTFTARDVSVLGGMALVGNPVLAAGWAAAKGIGRRVNAWAEPALAEMAIQRSIGAKAAAATQQTQFRIRESVRNFFKNAEKISRYGAQAVRAEQSQKTNSKYDRKAYEEAVSRAESLTSQNHVQKVQDLLTILESRGYGELSKSLFDTNQRAVQYVSMNMPPRRAAHAMASLRKVPQIHGLDTKEFKFLRMLKGITSPLSILDRLKDGDVGRDEVRAMKYVTPELHGQIVEAAYEHIQEMKASGGHLPMDKIAQLGLILDAPIDSMLDSSRIRPIQASFIPPEPPPDAPLPLQPQQVAIDPLMQTPMESLA